mgnify:CR=1 FL=1
MLKKLVITMLAVVMMMSSFTVTFANGFDIADEDQGILNVSFEREEGKTYKVLVQSGSSKYFYDLTQDQESFPAQMGNGVYTIKVYERLESGKYSRVASEQVNVNIDNENLPYLASTQNVKWAYNDETAELAKSIAKDAKTDYEKLQAVHNYVISTISYDYDKAKTVESGYLPVNANTLESQSGICYDYSSLVASMLRSLDVPTKLVTGYNVNTDVYHAWNEVLIDGEWLTVDTTFDAALNAKNADFSIVKPDRKSTV